MKRISAACIIIALLASPILSQNTGTEREPGDNPVSFRNSLHNDYSRDRYSGQTIIPEILPSDIFNVKKESFAFGDLLLSESVSPANFTQEKADICALYEGRMAVVWEDDRQGSIGVFLQLFDNDGNPIGSNLELASGESVDLLAPRIAADSSGNFYVVWREEAEGHIQAMRFDSLANPLTSVFFISDTTASGYAGEFGIDCLDDGRLVVVWEDYSPANNIAFQIFTPTGSPSTLTALANSDGLSVKHWSPVVAAGQGGDFAIVWEDYRDGHADIFFRLFNSLGLPYDTEFSLADASAPDSGRFLPSLTFSLVDGYLAAWTDLRDGQNIYMQKVLASGVAEGDNILLTTESSGAPNWEADLDVDTSGHLLAVWTIYSGERKIVLQRFSSGIQFDGPAHVFSGLDDESRYEPAVAGNRSGSSGIVWTDLACGSADILAIVYDTADITWPVLAVNDDTSGSPSIEPHVTDFDRFEWAVVFTDRRRDAGDIMLQRVYVGGDLIGSNRMINDDPPGGYQSQPAAASNGNVILISWTDERDVGPVGQNVYCRFSKPHYSLGSEILVNDDFPGTAFHYDSDCAVNDEGTALVVWTDTRLGVKRIYGQFFNQNFEKIGGNLHISSVQPGDIGESPKVIINGSDEFIVGYLNRLGFQGPAVEYAKVGPGVVSDPLGITSDDGEVQIDGFDIGINAGDEIIIVWHGSGTGDTKLYMTAFDDIGNLVLPSTGIVDNIDAMPEIADMSVDDLGYILLTWIDHRTGMPSPFRQLFKADFSPLQTNLPVYSSPGRCMRQPATTGNRGRGIFVWTDARADGYNIYASQEMYEPTDVDNNNDLIPTRLTLEQNYPNPFNPSTVIKFSLPDNEHVTLEIFNLLGQNVRTLVDQNYQAGNHSVVWDGTADNGRNVPTGIYLYRLQNGNDVRTRKMMLVK